MCFKTREPVVFALYPLGFLHQVLRSLHNSPPLGMSVHWWDTMDEWCFCIVERLSLREEYIKAVRFIFFIPVYKPIYSNFVRHLSEYLQDTEQLPKTSIKLFTQQTMLCCFCFARLFSLWKWQF